MFNFNVAIVPEASPQRQALPASKESPKVCQVPLALESQSSGRESLAGRVGVPLSKQGQGELTTLALVPSSQQARTGVPLSQQGAAQVITYK